jgi:hypothetical protein
MQPKYNNKNINTINNNTNTNNINNNNKSLIFSQQKLTNSHHYSILKANNNTNSKINNTDKTSTWNINNNMK